MTAELTAKAQQLRALAATSSSAGEREVALLLAGRLEAAAAGEAEPALPVEQYAAWLRSSRARRPGGRASNYAYDAKHRARRLVAWWSRRSPLVRAAAELLSAGSLGSQKERT